MGPSAIRYAGLHPRIEGLGRRCEDWGNVTTAVAQAEPWSATGPRGRARAGRPGRAVATSPSGAAPARSRRQRMPPRARLPCGNASVSSRSRSGERRAGPGSLLGTAQRRRHDGGEDRDRHAEQEDEQGRRGHSGLAGHPPERERRNQVAPLVCGRGAATAPAAGRCGRPGSRPRARARGGPRRDRGRSRRVGEATSPQEVHPDERGEHDRRLDGETAGRDGAHRDLVPPAGGESAPRGA